MKSTFIHYVCVSSIKPMRLETKVQMSPILNQRITYHTPWPESEGELYGPSDRRLSAKLVPTFADRGVSRSQRGRSPSAVISISRPEPLQFLPSSSWIVLTRLSGPVPDPLFLRKFGSAGNWTQNLLTCSQELWPLDYRRGRRCVSLT
jgi:hypothetical protein